MSIPFVKLMIKIVQTIHRIREMGLIQLVRKANGQSLCELTEFGNYKHRRTLHNQR